MKSQLTTLIIGAAIGALGMFLAKPGGDKPVAAIEKKPALTALGSDSDAKKIARLEKRITELESMGSAGSTDLIAETGAADTEAESGIKTSGIVKIFGDSGGESQIDLAEIQKQMATAEKERAAKRIEARLATLTKRLNLSTEQAGQVRALLAKQASQKPGALTSLIGSALGAATGEGEIEGAEIIGLLGAGGGADGEGFDFEAELDALLDDGQKSAYAEHVEAQNENFIEATAGGQLARLQTGIPDLKNEQKDRAFDEFARIAREDVETNGAPDKDGGFDIARMMRQRKAEQEAMQDILTPEQLEVYESNNRGANSITIGGNPGTAVFSTGVTIESAIDLPTPDPPADDSE